MAHIAFLGTGVLGSGFIEGMRSRGEAVTAWNRTRSKAEPLARLGVQVADSPAAAVREAARVHICVSDDSAVDPLIDGILSAIAPGTPIVDHTTVSPAGVRERYRRLGERDVTFVHAPVFMSPQMAKEAQGIMLSSAPRDRFERLAPALRAMTGDLRDLGDDPGRAASFKLFGNAMIFAVVGGLADIFSIAKAQGVSPSDAIGLFEYFTPANNIKYRGSKMAEGTFTPAMFELAMARKDLRLMIESADPKAPLALLPGLAQRFDELIAAGFGAQDVGVVAVDSLPQPAGATR